MIHAMSTGNTRDAAGEAEERKEKFERERDKSSSIANCSI